MGELTYDPRPTWILSAAVLVMAFTIAPIVVQRRRSIEATMKPDRFAIRLPRWYAWVLMPCAIVSLAIGVVAVLSALTNNTTSTSEAILAAILFITLAWLVAMFALWVVSWEVRVEGTTITVRGLFHKPQVFDVSQVSEVKVRMMPNPRMTIYVAGRAVVSVEDGHIGYTPLRNLLHKAGVPWVGTDAPNLNRF